MKRKRQDDEISSILKKFKVKIPSDESPEEIAKWIEERRKKFPTRENVEKKKEENLARNEHRKQMREKRQQEQSENNQNKDQQEGDSSIVREDGDNNPVEQSSNNCRDRRDRNNREFRDKKRKRRICSYFLKGKCKQGVNCKFLHEKPNPKPIAPPKRPPSLLAKVINIFLQYYY